MFLHVFAHVFDVCGSSVTLLGVTGMVAPTSSCVCGLTGKI